MGTLITLLLFMTPTVMGSTIHGMEIILIMILQTHSVRATLNPGRDPQELRSPMEGLMIHLESWVGQLLKGDQTLWSVYNDKGNVHTETQGNPIGMEIRAQYFAFSTNDEINDMTFYSYELINRSTYTLTNTYFSQWVDPDLGWAYDDYVGCDVGRGLGYCYNGNPVDGTGQSWAYGAHPPAVGVDFFQGPYLDPDGCDNPSFKRKFNSLDLLFMGTAVLSD